MRDYNPLKYIQLVENTDSAILKEFMDAELSFLNDIVNQEEKTIVDLGAGYGRIISYLKRRNNYYGIELNPKMYQSLKERSSQFIDAYAINGDITNLTEVADKYKIPCTNTIFTLLQNTIGTIEGDVKNLVAELKRLLADGTNRLVISFFKARALRQFGIKMFEGISSMVGEPDFERTDFERGVFVSKTGYEAKWWTDEEILKFINGFNAKVILTREESIYSIYYLTGKTYE